MFLKTRYKYGIIINKLITFYYGETMALFNPSRERKWFINTAKNSYKYYRSKLSSVDKQNYDIIFDAILYFKPIAKGLRCSTDKMMKLIHYVLRDNPVFYYTNSKFQYSKSGFSLNVQFDFDMMEFSVYKKATAIIKRLDEYKSACEGKSNLEIIKYVHDNVIKDVEYSFNTENPYQAYSVFTEGKAVCEGIAEATKLILDYLGVKCIIATGKSKHPGTTSDVNHAWNVVDVGGGEFYHLDVTFDDGISQGTGTILQNYFLLTNAQIMETHVLDEKFPEVSETKRDVFTMQGQYFTSLFDFEQSISRQIAMREKSLYYQLATGRDHKKEIEKSMTIIENVLRRQNVGVRYKAFYDKLKCVVYVSLDYHY